MPTVLVTGPTVTQNSPFSSLGVAVTITRTQFAYPRRDDQAELAWLAWLSTACQPINAVMLLKSKIRRNSRPTTED